MQEATGSASLHDVQPVAIHEVQMALFEALEHYTSLCTAYQVLQADHRRLERDLLIEPSTGLGTRRAGEAALKALAAQRRRQKVPLTVMVVEFEEYQSESGSTRMRAIGEVLRSTLREDDGIFRWAPLELVVVLPFTSREQGQPAAARVRLALTSWGAAIRSIGLAEFSGDEEILHVIERACHWHVPGSDVWDRGSGAPQSMHEHEYRQAHEGQEHEPAL